MRLRLTRVGSRKNPIWRVVAADGRAKRDGRVLETVGRYNPQPQPSEIVLDRERIDHWIARGAQPSDTVRKLIRAVERGAPPAQVEAEPGPAATPTVTAEPAANGETEAISSQEASGDPAASAEEGTSIADAAPADEIPSAEEGEG